MPPIRAYHRPGTIEEALDLLARSEVDTAIVAGGTSLHAPRADIDEVVDIQALGLDEIAVDGSTLVLGARVTLRELVDDHRTPGLLRELARREGPNTIRNAATVGGTVADPGSDSGLNAGLLAHAAVADSVGADGPGSHALSDLDPVSLRGRLVTAVRVDTSGHGAHAGTGRTPADTPIVLVAGRRAADGTTVLAASGVGPIPRLLTDSTMVVEWEDFRGSADYRNHLLEVLSRRVRAELEDRS